MNVVALEHDLHAALARRLARSRRRRRRLAVTVAIVAAASVVSAAAIASGIAADLHLDPTQWSVLGGGTTDNGRGAYVHAQRHSDGSYSTFLVEHDADLAPYQAFLLHEKTEAAAQATSPVPVRVEPGELCTPAELTRAEQVALATLRDGFAPGTGIDATRSAVDGALADSFRGGSCRGLEWAGEQARLVYAGVMPSARLMPAVR